MKLAMEKLQKFLLEEISSDINFDWDASGLTMMMSVDGSEVLSFSNQQEVSNLIEQLENLLAGPMRTSP